MASNTECEKADANVMAPMTSDYNKLNASQSTVWKYVKPLFSSALKGIIDSRKEHTTLGSFFRVADLGCATGGNSVAPLSFVATQIPIEENLEVLLGDLPQNSWTTVVTTVTPDKITAASDRTKENTFVYMVGRTFYDVCCSANTLDLSYCLVAAHWMKSYVDDIPGGLYATCPKHNLDAVSLEAWKEAGANDFADFTRARHTELKVGGRFIGVHACPKRNGENPWSLVGCVIYEKLSSKVDSSEALAACVLPNCYRTEEDVRAGFASTENCSWELESCEFHETKDPVRESFERGEMSSIEYGRAVVESFKAVCHPTCLGTLSKYMSSEDADKILNETYTESIEVIVRDPERYNLDVSFWYIVARKM